MPTSSARLALRAFAPLPLKERLFVRARLFSAPLEELARRAPPGRVADIGCGHGGLVALLSEAGGREVLGVDPDPRKIAWARTALGRRPGVELVEGTVEALLPARAGSFDAVTIADVLYLLPYPRWAGLLSACRALLKPGGVLLLKEAEDDGGWKAKKALWQEEAMVRLLRRTRSSGGLGFHTRAQLVEACREAGLRVTAAEDLSAGYSTPHLLLTATPA